MKFTLILVIVAILFHDVEIVFAKCSLKYVTRPMAAINYECSGIHLSKLEDELMSILSEVCSKFITFEEKNNKNFLPFLKIEISFTFYFERITKAI